MRQLESNFTKGWRNFSQLKKSGKAYLYEIRTTSGSIYYEVFRHKEHKSLDIVNYPGNNDFGSWAWATPDLSKAHSIFNLLTNGHTGRDINLFLSGQKL